MDIWKKDSRWMELGRKPDLSGQSIGNAILMKDILSKSRGYLSECSETININVEDKNLILNKMEELGGRLVYHFIGDEFKSYIWLLKDGILELMFSTTYAYLKAASKNEKFIHDLRKVIKTFVRPSIKKGYVYAIVVQGGRLALSSIGDAGIPLIENNYAPDVMDKYKFVVNDLNSSTPSGRIIIMEGEPGSGKTHLVRALLTEVKDAMFVLVSPDMVSSLGGPELLPLLLSQRSNEAGPIILILEDADKCLVTRAGDNINSIQSLLNLGDGILGSLLDLRIVATTNAKKLEMEPAIMRPGRLCKRIEVGALNQKSATDIFNRLLPEMEVPAKISSSKKHTLAEIYSIARECGWNPPAREIKNISDDEGDPREVDDYDDDE